MATTLERGTLFSPETVQDLVTKVHGHSSLAKLSNQMPLAFNGNEIFTFDMTDEIQLVGESAKKEAGTVKVEPVKVMPLKIEYGARVSDEFIYGAEEKKLEILKAFNDGFSKKVGRGLDLMAIHGTNPRTATASTLIGNNCFDKAVTQTVTFDAEKPDDNIEAAIGLVAEYANVKGIAMDKAMATALASLKVNGVRQYPELAWGANPGTINGCSVDVNSTVSTDKALVGDFEFFKWGIAKEIPLRVIEYGDPDQSGKDLSAYNQVYLRAEVYIGWAILDAKAFAIVKPAEA